MRSSRGPVPLRIDRELRRLLLGDAGQIQAFDRTTIDKIRDQLDTAEAEISMARFREDQVPAIRELFGYTLGEGWRSDCVPRAGEQQHGNVRTHQLVNILWHRTADPFTAGRALFLNASTPQKRAGGFTGQRCVIDERDGFGATHREQHSHGKDAVDIDFGLNRGLD